MVSPEEVAVVVVLDEEPSQRQSHRRVSAKDLMTENVDLRAEVTSSRDLIELLEAELRSLVVDAANLKATQQCSCQRPPASAPGQRRLDGSSDAQAARGDTEVLALQAEVEALRAKAEWEAVQRKAAEARLLRVASSERGRAADGSGGGTAKQMPGHPPVASPLSPPESPENSDEKRSSVGPVATEVLAGEDEQEQQEHAEGQHGGDSATEEGEDGPGPINARKTDADAAADSELAENGDRLEAKAAQGSELPALPTSDEGAIGPLEEELLKAREAAQRAEAWAAVLQVRWASVRLCCGH